MTIKGYHKDFQFCRKSKHNFTNDNAIFRSDSDLEISLEDLQHDLKILLN